MVVVVLFTYIEQGRTMRNAINKSTEDNVTHIYHVPSTSKSLLSVHCIALDNHVFLEIHPFLIKDEATKRIMCRGRCVDGFYPLIPKFRRFHKQVRGVIELSFDRWHHCLGHPALSMVHQVLSKK